jgi:threonine/homoserine/homoserine lactone efflux protein
MDVLTSLGAFTVAASILTVTPGLDTALVLRTSTVEGPRAAWQAGFGIVLGCLTWGALAAVGIGALLRASHFAYDALRFAGAGYLVFLGAKLLARALARKPAAPPAPLRAPRVLPGGWFTRGLLTNLLNPKVGVFYASFLPQFIPHGAPVTAFSMLLASIHAALGLLWFGLLIAATRRVGAWLARPRVQASLDGATGAVFVLAGARIALERGR